MIECCRHCTYRTAECHGACVKYKIEKDLFDEEMQKIKEKRYAESRATGVKIEGMRRMMRK